MKKILVLIVAASCLLVSCQKEGGSNDSNEDDDIAKYIEDHGFRNACIFHYDRNHDGKISKQEAKEITQIQSGANSLRGIEYFPMLNYLRCPGCQLTNLDVSKNKELYMLYCHKNRLNSLDVSKCTKLNTLDCHSNQLTSLDISKNSELSYLYCYDNQLTSLDVSKNKALVALQCGSQKGTLTVYYSAGQPINDWSLSPSNKGVTWKQK